MADCHLADLSARGFVDAHADFEATEGDGVGRGGLLLGNIVHDATTDKVGWVVIDTVGSLIN